MAVEKMHLVNIMAKLENLDDFLEDLINIDEFDQVDAFRQVQNREFSIKASEENIDKTEDFNELDSFEKIDSTFIKNLEDIKEFLNLEDSDNGKRINDEKLKNLLKILEDNIEKKKELEERNKKLEEYINSIFDKLDGQLDMVDTNNEVVNAVINAKYYEALQNDVLFILKINDLSHIKVSDEDIVTILSNLLDNAIEAAGQCDIDKRTVGIKLLYEDDVLSIAVSNSYKTEPEIMEDGYMRTIKDDKEQHGLGIRNVVATLEKYNAEYIIDYKNGEFVFSIIM